MNLGPKLKPFGAEVRFVDDKEIRVASRELAESELAGEGSLNAKDRVRMALEDGPMYPDGIATATKLALGTVKNALTQLRKDGLVEYTGEKDANGAGEVRLASSPLPIRDRGSDANLEELLSSPSLPLRDGDSDTEYVVRDAHGEMDVETP